MKTKSEKSVKRTKKLDKKNEKTTMTKVVESKRELKWKMPEEANTLEKKRAFRQRARNEMRKLESELLKNPSARLERKYKKFRREVLLVP